MAKDTRLWARFSLDFADHPKIAGLSDAAFRALVEMILYSREYLTDGVIPARLAMQRWGSGNLLANQNVNQGENQVGLQVGYPLLDELCSNHPTRPSLSRNDNGDYILHDYLDYQESRADVEARSRRLSTNGRKGGRPKKQPVNQGENQVGLQVANQDENQNHNLNKSRDRDREATTDVVAIYPATADADCGPAPGTTLAKPKTRRRVYPPEFETFWSIYPVRQDKPAAYAAWQKAITRASMEEINAGAQRYADDPRRDPSKTKYAQGWLNGDRWMDEPLPAQLEPPSLVATSRAEQWLHMAAQMDNPPPPLEIEPPQDPWEEA